MSKEEDIKRLDKKIREAEVDRKRALYDHNYPLHAQIKQAIKTLRAQKKHLEENSDES